MSLVLGDGVLPGHKMVLAARSDAWADLNEGDKVGKKDNKGSFFESGLRSTDSET